MQSIRAPEGPPEGRSPALNAPAPHSGVQELDEMLVTSLASRWMVCTRRLDWPFVSTYDSTSRA